MKKLLILIIISIGVLSFSYSIIKAETISERLGGKILLQVENNGEAWYVKPSDGKRIYMADGDVAYNMMRDLGLGISNNDLAKIPIGIEDRFECLDTDGDSLCDKFEEGIGTNINNSDTDGDGYNDSIEVRNDYNPLGEGKFSYDNNLINNLKGKILLQVESKGEAWYIYPDDGKRYYMTDGEAAYQIMRYLSLGISNTDLEEIVVEGEEVICTENWYCSEWSDCIDGQQIKDCTDLNNCGTIVDKPAVEQSCGDTETCTENWYCSEWSDCVNGQQTNSCNDLNNCGTIADKPAEEQSCGNMEPCTEDWYCSEWSDCVNGQQTKICTDLSSCGTIINEPAVEQSCTDTDSIGCTDPMAFNYNCLTGDLPGDVGISGCGDNVAVDDGTCIYRPESFEFSQSTYPSSYFVIEAKLDESSLEETKDWIGVFNGNVCVGSWPWAGEYTTIPAMGDDGSNYSFGYLSPGDIPTFKIYDNSSEEIYNVEASNINPENIPWNYNGFYTLDYISGFSY